MNIGHGHSVEIEVDIVERKVILEHGNIYRAEYIAYDKNENGWVLKIEVKETALSDSKQTESGVVVPFVLCAKEREAKELSKEVENVKDFMSLALENRIKGREQGFKIIVGEKARDCLLPTKEKIQFNYFGWKAI